MPVFIPLLGAGIGYLIEPTLESAIYGGIVGLITAVVVGFLLFLGVVGAAASSQSKIRRF